MIVIGCDPGPERSACVGFNGQAVTHTLSAPNADVEAWLDDLGIHGAVLVIEKVESFGMAVGAEVFETVFHSGRFARGFEPRRWDRLPRRDIKSHLCHSARATDANIRQAIIDRFGGTEKAIGRKREPGPLYTLKGHLWAAFAVALTWYDLHGHQPVELRPGIVPEF